MNDEQRAAVVTEAKTWLGTPYQDRQAVKGCGADCAMFPLAVYQACNMLDSAAAPQYAAQWHLHHTRELYLEFVLQYAEEIQDVPLPADFMMFRTAPAFKSGGNVIEHPYSHGAIVVEYPMFIHATKGRGVVYCDLSRELRWLERKLFKLKEQ